MHVRPLPLHPSFDSEDWGKFLLRVIIGGLILFHGIHKLQHFAEATAYMQGLVVEHGLPAFVAYGVYAGEVLGPVLVLIGLFTRIGGLLIAINMIFAIALVHVDQLLTLTDNGSIALELQLVYLFGGMVIACLGAGRISLRDLVRRNRSFIGE